MKYELPKLNYNYDALEPHIDAQTMEIHHTKHHQAYIDKLNAVLEKHEELQDMELSQIMRDLNNLSLDPADKAAIQNHGGGHLNHSLFWEIMDPGKEKNEELGKAITDQFGSQDSFKEEFNKAAATQFGSGWAWLVRDENNTLQVYSTANQDSPYLNSHEPVLGLDVWEHAYYLKYQNKRPDYISAWWEVVEII
jgi:superoxide dismutase, Fe-Mn family